VSLPIGAAEVTVLDMTSAYAVFANGGKRAAPQAAVEIRNSAGEVIYKPERDAPAQQVLQPRVVEDMNFMLSKVPEEGTGRRAALEGIKSAGKTGTTNGYRDAWYVGYTGNLVAGVWFGNDDYESTANMTGGTLPAMAWKEVMAFAHQNLEIKPMLGVPSAAGATVAGRSGGQNRLVEVSGGASSGNLSRRSFEVISGIGDLLRTADRRPFSVTGAEPITRAAAQTTGGVSAVGNRIARP
jgi:penicillin-binding protein 1A